MVSIPYALSVSHFINTVGADAGFAAIIGLALLVLLFFAQMRETSHLRDQVADATDHVSHLEYQIAQLSRGGGAVAGSPAAPGVAPRPASVPATGAQPAVAAADPVASRAVAPAAARAVTAAPLAPAGVGAPALASATRLIPAFDDGPISVRQTGAAAVTGRAAAAAAAAAGAGASGQRAGGRDAAVMDPPGPPPATAAGGANGSRTARATPPPASAGTGAPGSGQGARPPAPRSAPRSPAGAPRRSNYSAEPRTRLRGLLVALIALVVVAAIVVVLLLLTGGSSSPTAASSTSQASNAPSAHRRTHRAATIKPASVNVVVLNGTSTPNLAHDVTQKLQGAGYKLGTPATATDQTHSATVVAYLPGHRAAALIVAKSLGLSPGVVSAADQSSQAVACPQSAACSAKVIVTVGADLNSVASSSPTPAPAAGTGTAAGTSTG